MNTKRHSFLLLAIIYIAFISLGLPDGVLGVAWPSIRLGMKLPLELVAILTTLLLFMSAFSSFISGRLLNRFGTGKLTFISGLMTGLALIGYSVSPNFLWLLLFTIPLGFGQGAVDSGLNLYVAKHYSARHMNWLHCFWGLGATGGPMIMTFAIANMTWRSGYAITAGVQLALTTMLFLSIFCGMWKEENSKEGSEHKENEAERVGILSNKMDQGLAVLLFFLYSGIEFSVGTWLNSVLIEARGISVTSAGLSVALYYAAIMAGRFLSGFIVNRLGNMRMIRIGLALAALGSGCLWISGEISGILVGTVMLGLGLAPFYPCLMHETPVRFTRETNQKLIGYQVGTACLGGSIVSSVTGLVLSSISLNLLFPIVILLIVFAFVGNEILNKKSKSGSELA